MSYKTSLLFHTKAVQDCLPRFRAEASVDIGTFQLEVRARNRFYRFIPQFIYKKEGRLKYSLVMPVDVQGFIGWLPYFNKQWPAANDKLAFKRFCDSNDLRTPQYSVEATPPAENYLIKSRTESFGVGMSGPYRRPAGQTPGQTLAKHQFFEEFIIGEIAKIWYWNKTPLCLELRAMPVVTGDGKSSLRDLILAQAGPNTPFVHWNDFIQIAEYQNTSLDAVLPEGAAIVADYRYGSPLYRATFKNLNVIDTHRDGKIGQQIARAGACFWNTIPEEMRQSTLYTVDAIVDREQTVWFLEMNCNPTVHCDVYFPMFEALFGPAEAETPKQAPKFTVPSSGLLYAASPPPFQAPPPPPSAPAKTRITLR